MPRITVVSLCTSALLLAACATQAQVPSPPAPRISAAAHPNLAAAERLLRHADRRLLDSQAANHWDLQGHAALAKQMIEQAMVQVELSAQASNREHR